ncbi:dipeptide ABC transporter ATP-binding protein [uncultured Tateyamaria sp.]|uniref:ABC transporter ATP-binding protein n=1 Tax=uncultured Tateyamaria sp. TaxID=455651 RepID=UPI00262EB163|nr:dipeptide ABC transporter ATP-binding protein [uncultured Tateyamaria sp.]
MTLLRIDALNVQIGGTPILRDVSLSVSAGEVVAVTGESGSGKSMTALSVMQLLPDGAQATGSVTLDGHDLLQLDEPTLCTLRGNTVGMVFQEPMTALNPVMTIGAQVAETLRLHRPDLNADAQARAVLDRVELHDIPMARFPHELSGGQRQRVVIAIAIACGPKLLIADEPTTALDVTTQAQILALLKRLAAEDGMGLLMITHDLAVVAQMADRITVMRHGEVVEDGTTAPLLTNPAHDYTRALLAASTHRVVLPEASSDAPLLRVDSVVRDYALPRTRLFAPPRHHRAVDGVSFDIPRGGRIGLVGESGCGKSTLTRAILGLEPVQAGSITLDGTPVTDPGVRRKMQVVFQDPYGSFNPRHRVSRLITEPFHLLPEPPPDRADRIATALTDVGLSPGDADKYPHQFSGGQRQRLAIARALIIRPELVIFDEAVSALDVSVRAQILDLIAGLCKQYNLTYLFISHDLSVVRTITDRVLVMQAGKIVEDRPTETVFTAPTHPYTRTLIDAAPTLPQLEMTP